MAHLARTLLTSTRIPQTHTHFATASTRLLGTSTLRRASATAFAPSSPDAETKSSTSSSTAGRKTYPARRAGYSKVTSSSGAERTRSTSAPSSTGPPRLMPARSTAVVDPPASPDFDPFPMPQPLAELPDYAALTPPIVSVENDEPSHPAPPSHPLASPIKSSPPSPRSYASSTSPFSTTLTSTPQTPPPFSADSPTPSTALGYNDWTTSFHGLSVAPFEQRVAEVLMRPLKVGDVEVKPDGLLYLPEIKYRRTLNEAFGPGGWGLAPRSETEVGTRNVSREWGLVCLGRLVAIARGEQEYFDPSGVPTATEACKSNALMRCCKDLGIASELWDPSFIREFKKKHCTEAFVEHAVSKKKRKLWRKNDAKFEYPYKEG